MATHGFQCSILSSCHNYYWYALEALPLYLLHSCKLGLNFKALGSISKVLVYVHDTKLSASMASKSLSLIPATRYKQAMHTTTEHTGYPLHHNPLILKSKEDCTLTRQSRNIQFNCPSKLGIWILEMKRLAWVRKSKSSVQMTDLNARH